MTRRQGGKQLLRRTVTVLLGAVLFACSLLGGAIAHLNLPSTRLMARDLTTTWFNSFFSGKVTIGQVARLASVGVTLRDIAFRDPKGRMVLEVGELDADFDLYGIAFRLSRGYQKISIVIDDVTLRDPKVHFYRTVTRDETGQEVHSVSIAETFYPRVRSSDEGAGTPVRVWFPKLRILHLEGVGVPLPNHPVQVKVPALSSNLLVTEKGVALDIDKFGLRATGLAQQEAIALGNVQVRAPGTISGEIRGRIGQLPLHQRFRIDGDDVFVAGELPEVEKSMVDPLVSGWPLDGRLRIKNEIRGTLPRLNAALEIETKSGVVVAKGLLTVAPGLEADLDVDTQALDLADLRSDLPRSSLNLRSSLEVWMTEDRPNFEINATLLESTLDAQTLPIIDLRANYDERGLIGKATLHERGLPLHVDASGKLPDDLDFTIQLRQTELSRAPRVQELVRSSGFLEATLEGHLGSGDVRGRLDVRGTALSASGVSAKTARLKGDLQMPLTDPKQTSGEMELVIDELAVGPVELTELQIRSRGPLRKPEVLVHAKSEGRADVTFRASADLERASLDGVEGSLQGFNRPVEVRIAHFHAKDSEVVVKGLHVHGEGTADLDLTLVPQGAQVRFGLEGLDLARTLRAAGLEQVPLSGKLDGNGDLALGESSRGRLRLAVREARLEDVDGIQLELTAELDDKTMQGSFSGAAEGRVDLDSSWVLTVPHSLMRAEDYPSATGLVSLGVSDVDLAWLGELLPERLQKRFRASGRASAELSLSRDDPEDVPSASARLTTRGLEIEDRTSRNGDASDEMPTRIAGLDLDARAALKPSASRIDVATRLMDRKGDLVTATASVVLPVEQWMKRPPTGTVVQETLVRTPIDAVALLPRRKVADLPTMLQPKDLSGEFAARVVAQGTPLDPVLNVSFDGREIEGPVLGLSSPIASRANLLVRPNAGRLTGTVEVDQVSRRVATLSLDTRVPSLAGEELGPDDPLWTGAIQLFLEGTPLGLFTALSEQQVDGDVQGSVSLTRLDRNVNIGADVRLRQLQVREQRLGMGAVSIKTEGEKVTAHAEFDDEYGNLDIHGAVSVTPTPTLAEIDFDQPLSIRLEAKDYDAAVLAPFAAGTLSELSGSLLGGVTLEVIPQGQTTDEWRTEFGGHVTLSEGTLTPSAMGLRLEDVQLALVASREGDFNVVRLEGFRARARSNEVNLRGKGAAYFRNLTLERATLELNPVRFPALAGGSKVADLSGRVTGQLTLGERENRLDLHLAGLEVELPAGQDRGLIDQEDNTTIDVVERPRDVALETKETPRVPLLIGLDLGSGIRATNSMMTLVVSGNPEVELGEETRVNGDLELAKGGRVQVLGKVFVIDYGRVMFNPSDSTNPHLDVVASWRASSGVIVRATISGTVEEPVIEWSSEPPLPGGEAAVIAMVVGSGGKDQDGIPLGLLSAPLNQALRETGVRGVEFYAANESEASEGQVARLSDRSWNSYTASVQLSDELWFEGSVRQETSGQIAGTRDSEYALSGTLDWRFAPNWSARTEAGTLGFGLDLQWQYRY